MRLFKSDWVDRVLQVLKIPDDVPIENKRVTNAIANAQGQVESQNFESRKNVLKYDDVMDRQRKVIYSERREVLEGADIEEQVRTFIDDVVTGVVTGATQEFSEEWDLEQLWTDLKQIWPVSLDLQAARGGGRRRSPTSTATHLIEDLQKDAQAAYDRREQEVGEEVMRELERRVLLSVLDRKWREHLYEMDYLREGIYLRAYSQRDPLVEYQREGFDMFAAMMDGIKEEAVGFLFNLEVSLEEDGRRGGRARGGGADAPGHRRLRVRRRRRVDAEDPLVASGPSEQPNEELESPAAAFVRSRRSGQGAPAEPAAAEPVLLRAVRGRRGRGQGRHGHHRGRPVREGRSQRAVPVRLGQEVQDVPRPAGGAHRADRARRRRLTARQIHKSAVWRTRPAGCTCEGPMLGRLPERVDLEVTDVATLSRPHYAARGGARPHRCAGRRPPSPVWLAV